MKKSVWSAALIFTILFSSLIIGQQLGSNSVKSSHVKSTSYFKRVAKKAFNVIPASLDSKIPGIVEGTIFAAIEVKKYYPSGDYTEMVNKLNRISEENPDPSIRVKAHLASIYLTTSNVIDVTPDFDTYDHDYIYKQITEQLEKKLLVEK